MAPTDMIPDVKFYINFWDVLQVILTTGLLFLVLKHFFWNSLKTYLETRQEFIEKSVEQAKKAEMAALNADEMAAKKVQLAKKEALEIVNDSKHKAMKVYDELVNDAKRDAQSKLDNATREINYQREKMKEEVKEQMVDIALLASEQLLKEKVDATDDKKLVTQLVDQLN